MIRFLFAIFMACINLTAFTQSVFNSGDWLKLEVNERGVYQVTYRDLERAGIPIDDINPKTIKIYSYLAGILPQPNAVDRPYDPFEIPIMVQGESDLTFDSEDFILFYGQSAHTYSYTGNELSYHHNPYAEENYYFMTYGGDAGQRIMTAETATGEPLITIDTYDDFRYYKKEQNNLLTSGREWYSERFSSNVKLQYPFRFDNAVQNSEVKITVSVMAQAFENSNFTVFHNNATVGSIEVPSIPNFNNDNFRYAIKGVDQIGVFSSKITSSDIDIEIEYLQNGSYSVGYLNYILVETKNALRFGEEQLILRSIESTNQAVSTYRIQNAAADMVVWDITDPYAPTNQPLTFSANHVEFTTHSDVLHEFIAFNAATHYSPVNIARLPNQNLKGLRSVEFLIISHAEFTSEANRLAQFRQQHDGLTSQVVELSEVYNEFSAGRHDVTAIRDFAKYLYDNGSLKYLLLFGRGSYDYKNVISNNTNFIPIYESRNSLDPLETYASDDYYAFLEDEEGDWPEVTSGAHTMDIGIGRLPVTNSGEAKTVVDKIIHYATSPTTIGKWRNGALFVADDGDFNLHQRQADQLTVFVDTSYSDFEPKKLYLDDFPQVIKPSGETAPKANDFLDEQVNEGALIVNFTGHGGETGWMQEQVLDILQIENWDNYDKLPLFVTATCEFGRHDDPRRISAGEVVVTSETGGGIAIFSTCRPVSSASNFNLNKAFYEVVYERESGSYLRLGDIFRLTKNNENANSIGNRNFALLGDPTIRLSYPAKDITITSINGNAGKTDTLKAQSKVLLTGEIGTNGQLDTFFNGTVEFVIYDKEVERTTLGNESAPFTYKSKDNIIFKGSSSVTAGLFDIEFIVPKNISYRVGTGKVNMYAYSTEMEDANGADIDLLIGSSIDVNPEDMEGPKITLFMGDTLTTDLSNVSHNTHLVVKLHDESGINVSAFGLANNITAELDGEITYLLNDYYEATKDSYQEGYIVFPLNDLEKGTHLLKVKASDVHNNTSEATIEFTVADPNTIVIYELSNYPNPFSNTTNFVVSHNRSGENISLTLDIISPHAGVVMSKEFSITDSPSDLIFYEWDGKDIQGEKLPLGLYIYRATLRSTRDGVKNEVYNKLILIN